jgi:hypothetical protein
MNDVNQFFGNNEIVMEKVIAAASQVTSVIPFVTTFLSHEDRWHIMNICVNRVSALFGPFHVFFNEARRCKSYFRSAWYLFTLSSSQNQHHGRFFVTPYKPVLSKVDMGVKRLRIDLVNEQEMREICAGTILPPKWGFFNNRHKQRWELLTKMSELFENQLVIVNDHPDPVHPSSPPSITRCMGSYKTSEDDSCGDEPSPLEDNDSMDGADDSNVSSFPHGCTPSSLGESWSNLSECLRNYAEAQQRQSPTNPRELAFRAIRSARKHKSEWKNTDNCIMRVHIPYPSSVVDSSTVCETHAKDVVLFE